MNYLKYIILLLAFNTAVGQSEQLESLVKKYKPFYERADTRVGFLVEKGGSTQTARIGFDETNTNTVFNIGSATKTFTAVLILQEMEKGRLKLSDSIGKFLTPIPNVDGQLTIEQLLRHESGLAESVGNQSWNTYEDKNDQYYRYNVYDSLKPQDTAKVGQFNYKNTNYILLGEILEKINDKRYEGLLEERIFQPLGMKDSYAYISTTIPNLVHPFTMDGRDVYDDINFKYFANYSFSAGSIASSLKDMVSFYHKLYESETLISKESFKMMTDFQGGSYGLGLQKLTVDNVDYIGHGGNNYGYAYRNLYNRETGNMMLVFHAIVRPFFNASLREDMDKLLSGKPIQQFRENTLPEFKSYLGDYRIEKIDIEFSITENKNQLYFNTQGFQFPLTSLERGILYDGTSGIEFKMKSENPNQLIFLQNDYEFIADRIETP